VEAERIGTRCFAFGSGLSALLLVAGCSSAPVPVEPPLPFGFEPVRVLEVEGRQGVATDGKRYFVSGSASLHVYSRRGELLLSNESPFDEIAGRVNHIGDIGVHGGEIYAGVEWFEDGAASRIQVAVYDAETLRYLRSIEWEPDSGQREVSAVAVDPERGLIWITDWIDGSHVYRYRLADGSYAGKARLVPPPRHPQGIAVLGGRLYITADDGDADLDEPDNLWSAAADPVAAELEVRHEMSFGALRRAGEIEGLDFDAATGEMLVLSNRGARIVKGMPRGFYPGYEREIREIYVFELRGASPGYSM
jgi:hypothetical protein